MRKSKTVTSDMRKWAKSRTFGMKLKKKNVLRNTYSRTPIRGKTKL